MCIKNVNRHEKKFQFLPRYCPFELGIYIFFINFQSSSIVLVIYFEFLTAATWQIIRLNFSQEITPNLLYLDNIMMMTETKRKNCYKKRQLQVNHLRFYLINCDQHKAHSRPVSQLSLKYWITKNWEKCKNVENQSKDNIKIEKIKLKNKMTQSKKLYKENWEDHFSQA